MEIQVGEYMRSDSGIILKYEYLKKYEDEVCFGQKGKCWSFEDEEEFEDFIEQRIVKHSPDIIDLIEVEDIITIEHKTTGRTSTHIIDNKFCLQMFKEYFEKYKDDHIVSILTKEQFNQRKYIVGGD